GGTSALPTPNYQITKSLNFMSLLWKIEGEGLSGASYLFGTMHVRDSRAWAVASVAMEKIQECPAFAAEFHLGDQMPEMPISPTQLPENQSLQEFMPPRRYKKLRKIILRSARLDLDHFKYAPPFLVLNLIGEQILKADMPYSLDEHLWEFAKQERKSLHGIETLREQLETLQKIPLKDQVKMLLDASQNISSYRRHLLHLSELYFQGDARRIFKIVKKSSKGLRKLLLYRRNEVMAERIAALARQQQVFAAIGAGHLGGGKGVVKLLKMKGLKVKQIVPI
ncbi:MAG: TraB/GumN family protein, partial [Bacteroidota bacterium]